MNHDVKLFMDVPTSLDAIKYDYHSQEFSFENDCNLDKIDVKEYLHALINVYGDGLLIEERINVLLRGYLRESVKYNRFKDKLEDEVKSYIEKNKASILRKKEDLEHRITSESKLTETEKQTILNQEQITIPPRPTFTKCEPISPQPFSDNKIFDKSLLSEPSKPEYKKPGLFNKNKINEENERIKAEYEHRLSVYRKTLDDFLRYQEEKKSYEESVIQYKQAKRVYDEEFSKYENELSQYLELKKQIQETFKSYEQKKKQAVLDKYQTEMDDFDIRIENCDKNGFQDYLAASKDYKEFRLKNAFYKEEISEASKALFEAYDLKEALLALNVIYSKYRGLAALATFYDYYESGRVTELTGPYGAYNLYESELRSNLILEKLDTIIDSLDSIKNNQYSLYTIMNQVNDNITNLDKTLNTISLKITDISTDINNIGDLIKQNEEQRKQDHNSMLSALEEYYNNKEATKTQITGNKNRASVILRGALGGALAGPVGAIIGAMSAIDKNLQ